MKKEPTLDFSYSSRLPHTKDNEGSKLRFISNTETRKSIKSSKPSKQSSFPDT